MKHLTASFILLPGVALAHGGHAPVPEAVHPLLHVSILVGVVVALAIGAGLWLRRRR